MTDTEVFSLDDQAWGDVRGLPGARGFEFKTLVADDPDYTDAYSCELVRLDPGDHSVAHTEPWNHTLYFLEGTGDLTIEDRRWDIAPGTVAKVKAGRKHSLRNLGDTAMTIVVVYDPPRQRPAAR